MKTIEIINIYAFLKEAKLTKMEDKDKFSIIKALMAMKPIAIGHEDFLENAKEKLKGDKHDEWTERARKFESENRGKKVESLSDDELSELKSINEYFSAYNKSVEQCVREEAEKEADVAFEKLTEEAFGKLIASNDWTCGQIMELSDLIVK